MPTKYKRKPPRAPWSRKKKPPTGTDADLNLSPSNELFWNEDKAREFLEKRRWPNGPVCPNCKTTNVYELTARPGSANPAPSGTYMCRECVKKFTVRVGTVFEDSKLPICKWLVAFHLITSSKKGISSHQMARELGITVKSAWFLTHRIREAMCQGPFAEMLKGTVEVDETYVGGKPRKGTGKHKRGRGTDKQPVMVLVERNGKARCKPIEAVNAKNLHGEIVVNVAKEAIVLTDEFRAYRGLGKKVARHETVEHGAGEFSREKDGLRIDTNTAEAFFALLKRGHYGIFHSMSKKHLHRYCSEFCFRWNHREVKDGERMVAAIKGAEGKRLMYRAPKGAKVVKGTLITPRDPTVDEVIERTVEPFPDS